MRLYHHKSIPGIPMWSIWDKPWGTKDAKMVATVLRWRGMYSSVLANKDHTVLGDRRTLRGAKREISEALNPITIDF